MIEPRAEGVIAGLIMIRNAENELLRKQVRRRSWLAATATLALPAFEKPSVLECRGQLLSRTFIRFVVTLAGPGEHHADDMMKIVGPNCVQTHATALGRQQELWFIALVFRGDKSA